MIVSNFNTACIDYENFAIWEIKSMNEFLTGNGVFEEIFKTDYKMDISEFSERRSEIEQNEFGVSVTQSYQYTKLNDEPTIITRWQGIKTTNGNEFRIGLGDGIPDSVEDYGCTGTAPCTPKDTDGDGIPNHKDLDSDNDGIPDSVEKGSTGANPDDTDGTGLPNYLDTDSDDDGILDAVERGIDGNNPLDTDGDGTPDYKEVDSDGDGIPDFLDTDDDGDGILTINEDINNNFDPMDDDSNNNGVPNYLDVEAVGIFDISATQLSLNVYPNPTQESLFLNIADLHTAFDLQIYNTTGQKVFEQKISEQQDVLRLNVANYAKGLYLIVAKTEKNEVIRANFVKN